MAERLKFKPEEINKVIEKITELVMNCKNISKLNLTAKDIFEKEKIKDIVTPTIRIPATVYTGMFELVMQSPVEISWHGLVKRDIENQIYTIYDLLIFPQINSPTATTTDEKDFAEWTQKLIMDMNFPIQDMRMHGHSHVNMSVFSSGIDDAYQNDLLAKVEDGDYYIFMILNKRHDICIFLYDYTQQILFTTQDIAIEILDENGKDIKSWAKTQIKEYCSEKKTSYNKTTNKYPSYMNVYDDNYDGYYFKDTTIAPRNFKEDKRKTWI